MQKKICKSDKDVVGHLFSFLFSREIIGFTDPFTFSRLAHIYCSAVRFLAGVSTQMETNEYVAFFQNCFLCVSLSLFFHSFPTY